MNQIIEAIKYPIGKYERPQNFNMDLHSISVDEIRVFPKNLKQETLFLSDDQLDTPYREGGWTVRQVVHHLADSHINSYIRMKLALTENNPIIKPYEETLWAEIIDAKTMSIDSSLALIEGLHMRWSFMLGNLSIEQLHLTFFHPEQNKNISIFENAHFYAFHGKHHLAQITQLKKRMGWK